jgi:hypothetical protein
MLRRFAFVGTNIAKAYFLLFALACAHRLIPYKHSLSSCRSNSLEFDTQAYNLITIRAGQKMFRQPISSQWNTDREVEASLNGILTSYLQV